MKRSCGSAIRTSKCIHVRVRYFHGNARVVLRAGTRCEPSRRFGGYAGDPEHHGRSSASASLLVDAELRCLKYRRQLGVSYDARYFRCYLQIDHSLGFKEESMDPHRAVSLFSTGFFHTEGFASWKDLVRCYKSMCPAAQPTGAEAGSINALVFSLRRTIRCTIAGVRIVCISVRLLSQTN